MIQAFDIYVYTKDLEFLGIIDIFKSLRWRRKYFEAGEFEIHMPLNSQTEKFLKKDNILIREGAVENGIIESWQITDNKEYVEVAIFGRFLSSILDRRIIKNKIVFNGKLLDGERKILNEMSPFSKLEIEDTTIESQNIIFQCTYKNVYNYLVKLAKASNIAHRITADIKHKKLVFSNYKGLDRTDMQSLNTRYEFSEDKANIDESNYIYSSREEKNWCLVAGSGEGENRILVEVSSGTYDDMDLKEVFIDASREKKDNNTSLDDYNQILYNKGIENLSETIETIEVTVYADDYKISWDLGDIVNVRKESWNVSMRQRIVEVEEVIEDRNQKIYATFGTTLAETLQED